MLELGHEQVYPGAVLLATRWWKHRPWHTGWLTSTFSLSPKPAPLCYGTLGVGGGGRGKPAGCCLYRWGWKRELGVKSGIKGKGVGACWNYYICKHCCCCCCCYILQWSCFISYLVVNEVILVMLLTLRLMLAIVTYVFTSRLSTVELMDWKYNV